MNDAGEVSPASAFAELQADEREDTLARPSLGLGEEMLVCLSQRKSTKAVWQRSGGMAQVTQS